jgi:hypothetical protein
MELLLRWRKKRRICPEEMGCSQFCKNQCLIGG